MPARADRVFPPDAPIDCEAEDVSHGARSWQRIGVAALLVVGFAVSVRLTPTSAPADALEHGTASDTPNPKLLAAQLTVARRVAAHYPTLAAALADGFTQAAPYAPGIGSHYMKYSRIYLPFDVSAPAMLLFNGDAPTSKIVGLAYYVYDSQGPPAGFAGSLDHWHQHVTTCVDKTGAHFDGNDDAIGCRGRGRHAWMLHLWVVPSLQAPQLIFSDSCNILT
jgi:hypothetical protein